ncbi:hypothetical protein MAR_009896 [Mya arenaria]|uniref:Uncharacterized protein n=1 Tax=Mya arenaria TaxID=6604 RepID=A0ABY7E3G9_MYAAR|nr:uncharacterized protein LOC128233089 [Mya arenaria]WAR03338.1 hypothetical protein MAR_009896 [Mya arenaria]
MYGYENMGTTTSAPRKLPSKGNQTIRPGPDGKRSGSKTVKFEQAPRKQLPYRDYKRGRPRPTKRRVRNLPEAGDINPWMETLPANHSFSPLTKDQTTLRSESLLLTVRRCL